MAIAFLIRARVTVSAVPFARWRNSLGLSSQAAINSLDVSLKVARRLAGQVERAAVRLPLSTKCLPRAAALSWILRRKRIAHAVVFAVRPKGLQDKDSLHAWVEVGGAKIIGELDGPWIETLRLGDEVRSKIMAGHVATAREFDHYVSLHALAPARRRASGAQNDQRSH